MKCGICDKYSHEKHSHSIGDGYSICHKCWSNTFYKDLYPEIERKKKNDIM